MSLGVTSYQTGRLLLIGSDPDRRLSVVERYYRRCMGLWASEQRLWMSSQYRLWRFENILKPGIVQDGFDRTYVPRVAFTIGGLDIHDVAVDGNDRVLFVNTRCSCLATISQQHSFQPLWWPPFVTSLAPEDRCHLNGLAMGDGRARYVTAAATTDSAEGWRNHRHIGGCVVDVQTNEIVAEGLSMPHSPRLHQETLWVLDSGNGYFGAIDLDTGQFEPITLCAGYLRGLSFSGDYAVVGVSGPRDGKTFGGLALNDELAKAGISAACGLHVIDLRTGEVVEWLRFEGAVREIYDVVVLPGVMKPNVLGVDDDQVRKTISMESPGEI